jgi:hypothetical protein
MRMVEALIMAGAYKARRFHRQAKTPCETARSVDLGGRRPIFPLMGMAGTEFQPPVEFKKL